MDGKTLMKKVALIACLSLFAALVPLAGIAGAAPMPVWTRIANNGISAPQNEKLVPGAAFRNKLVVGTFTSAGGGSLFTTDGKTFRQVGAAGLGNPTNTAVYPNIVYHGELYIGTLNPTQGGQLWRWTGNGVSALVKDSGVNDANNVEVIPFGVVNDKLIITASHNGVGNPGMRVFEYDGQTFTQLIGQGTPGTPTGPGFGNPNNSKSFITDGNLFRNALLIPVQNDLDGLQVYSYDGASFKRTGKPGAGMWDAQHTVGLPAVSEVDGLYYLGVGSSSTGPPAELWAFNGTTWNKRDTRAPGQVLMYPLVRGGDLYEGVFDYTAGCSVWRRTGTSFDRISDFGFSDTNNVGALLGSFNGNLLAMAENDTQGARVYSTPTPPSIDLLVPDSGPFGITVTIQSHDFGVSRDSSTVTFAGRAATDILSWSDTAITLAVPPGVSTGPVVVSTASGDSNPVVFSLTLSRKWYFAEGTTRDNATDGSYDEWLCIQNPGIPTPR